MKPIPKKTGHFESFDGTSVYYEVRGEKREGQPPLVFAYGLVCLINHFQPQLHFFSENHQTIIFDYRGHHKTSVPENRKNLSLTSIAKDIEGLLAHLEVDTAHFIGHSLGTQIILEAYTLFPEKFSSMTFINGFAYRPKNSKINSQVILPAIKLLKETHETAPKTSTALWKFIVNNPISIGISALAGGFNLQLTQFKDIEIYLKGVASISIEVFTSLFRDMMETNLTSTLTDINIPTLIISGDKDTLVPEKYQKEIHEKIKNSEFMSVPYGSHCTQLDFPELVNLRIEKFISK